MLIVRGFETPPLYARGCVVAIGNFDGVHRGHQVLIHEARLAAKRLGSSAGAIIFEPHPREFFAPSEPHFRLTPLPEKLRLFELYDLDIAFVLEFTQGLAGLSAEQFIETILIDRLGVRHIVVGYDFLFGKGRLGNAEMLSAAGLKHGFGVTVVAAQRGACMDQGDGAGTKSETGEVYSSSAIRRELMRGDVAAAGRAMGHWWRVSGTVVGGAKVGGEIGFPTANIVLPPGTALAHGIYGVRVEVDQKRYDGAAYFGTRPTVDDGDPVFEVTIFDFDGDLYGKEISVSLIAFVRPDKAFPSLEEMKVQIEDDCARVRELLAATGETPCLAPV